LVSAFVLSACTASIAWRTSFLRFAFARRSAGQFQHEIAAAYVINVRAVNQVLKEVTHVGSKEEAARRFGQTA